MPEQNQPIQGAFGDIYRTDTPVLDRVTQQLQQQFANRQAYQQKESLNTQEMVNKELANVRSIDMPDVIDSYNKWKGLKQNVLFNKSLQMNPKSYNAAQIEANAAYADVVSKINRSAQLNNFGKQLATDRNTPGKSNMYADDFGDKAAAFWNTSMSQLQNHPKYGDLSNLDNYRYKGMNSVNFGQLEKTAMGTPIQRFQKEEKISPIQKNITPYTFGNTPAQYQDSLRGAYATNPTTYRAASAAWEAIPQEEKDRVNQLYAQIPLEKWQQMGLQEPQSISPVNPNDPADNLAAYKAKIYAVNNNPSAGKMYSNIDQEAKLGVQFDQRKALEAIKENNREQLKTLGHQFKQMDNNEQASKLDDIYNIMMEDAKKSTPLPYKLVNGQVIKQYEVKASPILKKEFSIPNEKGHPLLPDAFRIDDSGKTITPIFFKPDQTGNMVSVDMDKSHPMTSVEFKARLGKALMGVKEANKGSNKTTTIEDLQKKYGY